MPANAVSRIFDPGPLDALILAAHEAGDTIGLAKLYETAANGLEAEGKAAEAAFYLTHAYVFALESALDSQLRLRKRLVALGRETEH